MKKKKQNTYKLQDLDKTTRLFETAKVCTQRHFSRTLLSMLNKYESVTYSNDQQKLGD